MKLFSKARQGLAWRPKSNSQKIIPLVFIIGFVGLGSYFLFKSFAAPPLKLKPWKNSDIAIAQAETTQIEAIGRAKHADKTRKLPAGLLIAAGQRRKTALLNLMRSDPSKVPGLLLSNTTLSDVSSVAGSGLEKKVSLSGQFVIDHRHYGQDQESWHYYIDTAKGKIQIFTNGQLPNLSHASKISLTGYQIDKSVFVLAASGTDVASITSLANTSTNTPLGAVKTVVISADFADTAVPIDMNKIKNLFHGTSGSDIESFYKEASYNKSWLDVTYAGPYKLAESAPDQNCPSQDDSAPIISELKSRASVDVDLSQYIRFIYIFNCKGYGTSTSFSPGSPKASIVMDLELIGYAETYAHELAHDLGNYHASYYACGASVFIPPTRFDEGCASLEYGDVFDTLGKPDGSIRNFAHLDPYHKDMGSWLGSGNYPVISAPGTYTYKLLPYETADLGVLALKIPRGNTGTSFTLEYRQPTGIDGWMADCRGCNVTEGASLRLDRTVTGPENGQLGGGSDTQLLDTTPRSMPGLAVEDDARDGVLLPGKTFTDPEFGISISTISADSTGATIKVIMPTQLCTRAQPTLTMADSSKTVVSGQAATYTIHVQSNDSTGCPATKYKFIDRTSIHAGSTGQRTLTAYDGAGNTGYFTFTSAPDVFTLDAGSSTDLTFTIKPISSTIDSTWTFSGANGVGTVSSNALEITNVATPVITLKLTPVADTTAPSQPSGLSGQALGSAAVSLNWTASTDNSGSVAGYYVSRDSGGVNYTSTPSFTDYYASLASGNHTYTIQAYDHNNNKSTTSSVTVSVPAKSDTQPPTDPTILSTSAASRSVTVNWTPVTDNTQLAGYVIYPFGVRVPADKTSWTLPTLSTNTNYEVHVTAYDYAGNESDYSVGNGANILALTTAFEGTNAPTQPTNLYPTTVTHNKVSLAWTPSGDDKAVAGYYIYRSTGGSGYSGYLRYGSTTKNSFSDTVVAPDTHYTYLIKAYDADGNVSPLSKFTQITTPNKSSDISPPNNVSVNSLANGQQVSGSVTIAPTATDNISVCGYAFWIDGHIAALPPTKTYTWDTTKTYDGQHQIYVVATDPSSDGCNGRSAGAAPVTVTVNNGAPAPPATTGTLQGTITSSTGGAVAGAKILIKYDGILHTYYTDSTGYYSAPLVPASTYKSVKFSAKNYQTQYSSITVYAGVTPTTKNITLVHL